MLPTRYINLRKMLPIFCGAVLGLCTASVHADPKPLSKEEQTKVDKSIDKAVAFLKRTQTKEDNWPRRWPKSHAVGQCALPAYALLEAGVPSEASVIQKAANFLRPKVLKCEQTYDVSLAILFFDRLGDPKDKKLIQSLALRLIASQYRTGGWTYRTVTVSAGNQAALLKSLEELNKPLEKGGQSVGETLRRLQVPRPLRSLTVFQDPETLTWADRPGPPGNNGFPPLVGVPDNSNTQFALLALWAAKRYEIPMAPTFRVLVERFERSQFSDGWWPYIFGSKRETHYTRSMICVGLLGLALGDGLPLPTPSATFPDRQRLRLLRGLAALYLEVGIPGGQMKRSVPPEDLYYLWSVERVGMLYNLPTIGDKDWYRWGVEIIVTNQRSSGGVIGAPLSLTSDSVAVVYGDTLNTAFALLFLKRAHPMKDLTPKLLYSGKELNRGIVRLLARDNPLKPSTTTPSRSTKSKR